MMCVVHLGAEHRRPLHVRIVGTTVGCPQTAHQQPVAACTSCPHLQGSLCGPDPVILCGVPLRFAAAMRGVG